MVQMNENIVGIDSAIFMHPTIWKASGHVDAFNDPLIDNKDSKNVTVLMFWLKNIWQKLKIK
jgi:glycyl-tRNA synthetase (class II)